MSKQLKLMSDYHCFPLWEIGEDGKENPDPNELPLSDELKSALHRWSMSFDETLNDDYPPDSGFARREDEEAFESEGLRLWQELQTQLRGTYEVVYYSQRLARVIDSVPSSASNHPVPTPSGVLASVEANNP